MSADTSWAVVMKNTSSPFSLASRNADSWLELPEEISPIQPLEYVQLPTPSGSYS